MGKRLHYFFFYRLVLNRDCYRTLSTSNKSLREMKKKSLPILFSKILLTCLLLVALSSGLSAQTITNYTFAASSGTFTALSGATSPSLTAGTTDDGNFNTDDALHLCLNERFRCV